MKLNYTRIKYSISLALSIILFNSCGLSESSVGSKVHLIQRGMTMEEVRNILGNPSKQTFDEAYYQWYYFHPIQSDWLLIFQDDKVIRLESISRAPQNTPTSTVAYPSQIARYPNQPYVSVAIDDAQFGHIYRSVEQAVGPDDELEKLARHASRAIFTPAQVISLMRIFPRDEHKYEALRILASSMDGTPLRYQIVEQFRFSSEIEHASQILATNPSRYLRPALPEEFDAFYHYVQRRTFKDDKILAIRTSAHSTLFSTDQCIRLMQIFTFDDDRLDILRLIAPNVLNTGDTHRILGQLSFSNSKDEARQLLHLP